MTDTTNNVTATPAAAAPAEKPEVYSVRQFFHADKIDQLSTTITAATEAANAAGVPVLTNFGDELTLPEGHGVVVCSIASREKGLRGVVIATAPTLETAASAEGGNAYLQELHESTIMDRVVASVRQRNDAVIAGRVPVAIGEFLNPPRRGSEGIAAYRAVAQMFVDALRAKGAKSVTVTSLRHICESVSFAKSEFPAIDQAVWVNIINTMAAKAVAKGESRAIFYQWLATRDTVEFKADDLNLDLSDLSGLV